MKKYLLIPILLLTLLITACTPTSNEVATHVVNFFDGVDLIWTEDVEDGKNVIAPDAPVKEGYDFVGWDESLENIKKDLDVNAIYKIKTFEVKFFVGSEQVGKTQIVDYGSNAAAPDMSNFDGIEFVKWDESLENIKKDTTINAIYNKEIYTVKFFHNNEQLGLTQFIYYGEDAVAPDPLTVEGYDFVGWDQPVENIKKDTIINAIYLIKKFEVKFYYEGEQIGTTQIIDYGEDAVAPDAPEIEGLTFDGWDKTFTKVKANLTINAIYVLPTRKITFYADTLGTTVFSEVYAKTIEEIKLPSLEPIKVGYKFISWDEFPELLTGDLHIYPSFDFVDETFDIFLDDYVTSPMSVSSLLYNELVTLVVTPPPGLMVKALYVEDGKRVRVDSNNEYTFRITQNIYTILETASFESLEIFYLNDFHGSILPNLDQWDAEMGMARIANFIKTKRAENPFSIFLSGGDMLQGSALSNYYYGESVIELLNLIDLDAFVIGNHEFDWGIEEVTKYFKGQNPIANYPLLAANVFEKGTNNLLDGAQPYTIIDRGLFKIGVIGYMGYNLESSIAYPKVKDYEFRAPVSIVSNYVSHLRNNENVDFVIVVGHDGSTATPTQIGNIQGVDMVFAGHSHQNQIYLNNADAPIVQSSSNGKAVGYVEVVEVGGLLTVDKSSIRNYTYGSHELFNEEDEEVAELIEYYVQETDAILNEVLIYNSSSIDRGTFGVWLAKLMMKKTGADIGTYNYGGVRDDIPAGDITLSTLYKILPFDNQVKSTMMIGSTAKLEMNRDIGYTYITIDNYTYYKIVTNDYVFDYPEGRFVQTDPSFHVLYDGDIRSWVEAEMRLQQAAYGYFSTNNPILSEQFVQANGAGEVSEFRLFV